MTIKLFDIWDERNRSRFIHRYNSLYFKLIKERFIKKAYEELDENVKIKLLKRLRKDIKSDDKTDYELFYNYAISNF